MIELLQHLWPDFSAMFSTQTSGLSAWFWSFTCAIFVVSVGAVIVHTVRFYRRASALKKLLQGQNKETLAQNRRETLQKAESLNVSNVGSLWREFDESLVSSGDQKHLFNTLDAEHFFNAKTLAPGLTGSRLLAAAPSFLVAIGVLGTFVGLTVGLEGLVGTSDEVEALKGGINELISGAAVAFMSSVWGVAFSLLLNFIEKFAELIALKKIRTLQQQIDFLYPRIPAEQSLVHIAEYGKESKEALQELHERIGDRLQETITGMSEAMQQAIVDGLNNVMAPAIQSLVNTSSQQSSRVLEGLMSQFMDGMTSAGREQGVQMQQAAADVNAAVNAMTERLNQVFTSLSEQQAQQQSVVQQQASHFAGQLATMSAAAEQREQQLEKRFRDLLGGLGEQIETQINTARQQDVDRQAAFEAIMAQSSNQQSQLLQQVSGATRDQLAAMAKTSSESQQQLENTVTALLQRISEAFEQQGQQSEQREQARQVAFETMIAQSNNQQSQLLQQVSGATRDQLEAMAKTSSESQQQLENTVTALLQQISQTFEQQGQKSDQRERERQVRLDEQLANITAQQQKLLDAIASAMRTTQEQSNQLAGQHQKLVMLLEQATQAVDNSSKHMSSSATQLGVLSMNLRQVVDELAPRLDQVAVGITQAAEQNTAVAGQLSSQAANLQLLQDSLRESAQRFEQAAALARDGFNGMKQHQEEFLLSIRNECVALGDALKRQVSEVEQQAEQWLTAYSDKVNGQVHERMDQWNNETLGFATAMGAAVQAISNVVEELESLR